MIIFFFLLSFTLSPSRCIRSYKSPFVNYRYMRYWTTKVYIDGSSLVSSYFFVPNIRHNLMVEKLIGSKEPPLPHPIAFFPFSFTHNSSSLFPSFNHSFSPTISPLSPLHPSSSFPSSHTFPSFLPSKCPFSLSLMSFSFSFSVTTPFSSSLLLSFLSLSLPHFLSLSLWLSFLCFLFLLV